MPRVTGTSRIRVKLLGDKELRRTFKAMEVHAQDFVAAELAEVADKIQEEAKRLSPVGTGKGSKGHMRDNINVHFDQLDQDRSELRVSVDVDYAKFVEFGTIYMSAQPFLRPALEKHKPDIVKAVEFAMDELARDSIVKVVL